MTTIAASVALILGVLLGTYASWGTVTGPIAVGLALALVAVGLGVGFRADARGRSALALAGVLVFGVLRGLSVSSAGEGPGTASRRGQSSDAWRELRVEGPAIPGPRCRVRAGGRTLELPESEPCTFASGERILVRAPRWDPPPGGPAEHRVAFRVDAVALRSALPPSSMARRVADARRNAWAQTRGDDAAALTAAVVFGMPSALPPERRDALRRSGLGHLLAVSGVHVGLFVLWVQWVLLRWLSWARRGRRVAIVLSWIPMVAYVVMTGGAASAVRAAIMIGSVGLADLIARPHHPTVTLLTCAAAMLALRPEWIADVGFQLSFAAMAALLPAPGRPARGVWSATWRVTWFLAPLTWWTFRQVAWAGLVTNPVALPVFGLWTMPASLLGWALEPWVGMAALEPARWGARLLLDLAEAGASAPAIPWHRVPLVAGLALVAAYSATLARRIAPRVRGQRYSVGARVFEALRPPRGAAVALLVVSMVVAGQRRPEPGWWVIIEGRAEGERAGWIQHGEGAGCIAGAEVVSAGRWLAFADELRLDRVRIDIEQGAAPGPRTSDLLRRLRARGLGSGTCARRLTDGALEAARACAPLHRKRVARGSDDGAIVQCWAHNGWRNVDGRVPLAEVALFRNRGMHE